MMNELRPSVSPSSIIMVRNTEMAGVLLALDSFFKVGQSLTTGQPAGYFMVIFTYLIDQEDVEDEAEADDQDGEEEDDLEERLENLGEHDHEEPKK